MAILVNDVIYTVLDEFVLDIDEKIDKFVLDLGNFVKLEVSRSL